MEKGIATRDRASLVEGKQIFERLVADGASPTWCTYFDLGNAQSALGQYREAIDSYRRALDEKSDQVEILKNLGSTYHRVGEHALEIECFDRALEIDPRKAEALASKRVSLMVDFDRPAEAAELLHQALKWHREWAVAWPHFWYWLAKARRRSGDHVAALAVLSDGLSHQPGHRAMRRLKSDVLLALSSTHPERASEAEPFWRAQLDISPGDYGTRERLMRLRVQHGDADGVWALMEGHLQAVGLRSDVSLRDSGFSIEDCITALRFTRQYLAFRTGYPVAGYWVEEDALYDLDFAPPSAGHIQEALTLFTLVPFGLGFATLEASSADTNVVQRLRNAFDPLRARLTQAIARASKELSSIVPFAPESREVVPNKLAEVLTFIGLVALREFGRQRGWIASQFPISNRDLNLAIDEYNEAQIEKDVVAASLLQLNGALHLFAE